MIDSLRCSSCRVEKSTTEFYEHSGRSNGFRSECKECCSLIAKRWRNDRGGREYMREYDKKRKEKHMIKIIDYLILHPCVDCGEEDVLVLEFDHVEGKVYNVTTLLGQSWKRIQEEIDRCQVRCANCHKRKTAKTQMHLRYRLLSGWPD